LIAKELAMAITVEATYENGVLRPLRPLPLAERQSVSLTIEPLSAEEVVRRSAGAIKCNDPEAIEHIALDKGLEYDEDVDE
jgi:predicted DNA-binding antitoxin AbrB/MazE fold protein